MKYRDNMTEAELAEFMKEVNELDALLASAHAHDLENTEPMPDEWEDEMEILRKAALSNGKP